MLSCYAMNLNCLFLWSFSFYLKFNLKFFVYFFNNSKRTFPRIVNNLFKIPSKLWILIGIKSLKFISFEIVYPEPEMAGHAPSDQNQTLKFRADMNRNCIIHVFAFYDSKNSTITASITFIVFHTMKLLVRVNWPTEGLLKKLQ